MSVMAVMPLARALHVCARARVRAPANTHKHTLPTLPKV
jgi:hypothetical protein